MIKALTESNKDGTNEQYEALKLLINVFNIGVKNQFLPTNCLRRSMAMHRFLKRRHISTQLVIGTRFEKNEFKGHAWLEKNNRTLNDRKNVREDYQVLDFKQLSSMDMCFD